MQKRMMEMMQSRAQMWPECASGSPGGREDCDSQWYSRPASTCQPRATATARATAGTWAASPSTVEAPPAPTKAPANLVRLALADPRFSTLVKALVAADLVGTLQGEGPFTVFAPTDAAFGALPDGILQELLQPGNKEKLVSILTCHVVPGRLMADVIESTTLETVGGQRLTVKVTAATTSVGPARVVETDLAAANGVLHVIDQVLLPPANA